MPQLIPVDHDPFATGPQLVPVDHDPFAESDEGPGTFLHPNKPKETGWRGVGHRLLQYPGMALGALADAVTLPHDAMRGELGDLQSPESVESAMPRILNAATFVTGAPAGSVVGRGMGAVKLTPNMRAAQTAADMGAPLPIGAISESPAVQAFTSAAQQFPIVGPKIMEPIGHTIERAGEEVGKLAEDLSGGAPDRATVGANVRPSLKGVIDSNNARIGESYDALRGVIDPDKRAALPRTRATLGGIMADRMAAGHANPLAGLDEVLNLARDGASFNGLQRARTDLSRKIDFDAANGGFAQSDLKRLRAAMSGDMDDVVRSTAQPGIHPDNASSALKAANGEASKLIDANSKLQRLLANPSDEGIVGTVIKSAQDKGGNAKLLMQLRAQMPKADFEQIAGLGLHELGHNPATGEFSLNKFARGWENLGSTAKNVLFPDAAHQKMLDDIAHLGMTLKASGKTANTSHTGAAVLTGYLVEEVGHSIAAALSGDPGPILHTLSAMGGGYVLSRALARPATAASIAKWAKSQAAATGRNPNLLQHVRSRLTRNMILNLQEVPGYDEKAIAPLALPR